MSTARWLSGVVASGLVSGGLSAAAADRVERPPTTAGSVRFVHPERFMDSGDRQDVRILRDVYPPRISLHFALLDAEGAVLRAGARALVDLHYLTSGPPRQDDLRHEKALLDDWLRRELGGAHPA